MMLTKARATILFLLVGLFNVFDTNAYEMIENGITLRPQNYSLTGVKKLIVKVYADDIIQVIGLPEDTSFIPVSMITADFRLSEIKPKVDQSADEIQIKTNQLKIIVNKLDGRLSFRDVDDRVLLQTGLSQISSNKVIGEKVNNIKQAFRWMDDEALYGLGQHQTGVFNWRGHYVELFQHNMRAIVPFLLSTKGYGILWDNYS